MEKLFLENTSYICIHYIPSKILADAIKNLNSGIYCNKQFAFHRQFHITLLYVPINAHCYQEAVNCVQESNHPEFPTSLTFSAPQKTPYGTIQVPVDPRESLEMLHRYFYSILKPYIHNMFINAYTRSCIDEVSLKFIHTRNLGKNYSPHMTIGYIQNIINNADIDMHLGSIFPTSNDVAGVFLSDANNATLKPILLLA